MWTIRLRGFRKPLGFVTLQPLQPGPPALHRLSGVPAPCELTVVLTARAWGLGYAQEAARLVLRHAFEQLCVRSVGALCHAGNGRGQVLLQRLGFTNIGDRAVCGAHRFAYLLLAREFESPRSDFRPPPPSRRDLPCVPNS
jgi:RimJ/RimL family protein N-acetyltransferase